MTPANEHAARGGDGPPGAGLRRATWWGTGIFALTAGVAAAAPDLGPSGPSSGVLGPSGPSSGVLGPSGPSSGVSGPSGVLEGVAFAVAVGLFLAGCVLFFSAYLRGVARSRTEQVAVSTLFFLAGDVPSGVRRSLFGSLGAQVVVALATAIARPYTSLAAGALVPMYGLGLCGLWAARHASFPPRALGPRPSRPGSQAPDPPDEATGSVSGS